MTSQKISYAEPDEVLTAKPSIPKYLKYILFFGPGAILASMTIGQGQLIMGPQIGGWAGYGLMWLITINLSSYIFCYIGTRFTTLSGISIMDIFAHKTRRGWFNWIIVIVVLIFIPIFAATIITTSGQALAWIFLGTSQTDWYIAFGIASALLVVALIFRFKYKILEHVQVFFVVVLAVGAVLSAVMAILHTAGFDFGALLGSFFNFGNVPQYPQWVVDEFPTTTNTPVSLLVLGYLGTLAISMIPLVGYLSWAKVKHWGIFRGREHPGKFGEECFTRFKKDGEITYLPDEPTEIKRAKKLMTPLKVDLFIAFVLVAIVSACYVICGDLLLGLQPDGTYILPSGMNLIEEQAVIFTSIASWLQPLFKISVFFAFFGTMYAGFEAATRMLHETGKHIVPGIQQMEYRRFMGYFILYVLVVGIPISLMIFKGLNFMIVLSITLLFLGVICVLLYGVASIYMSQKILPQKYRLGIGGLTLGIIGVLLSLAPFIAILL